nr:hypothetical protein [Shewanella seohaensis]
MTIKSIYAANNDISRSNVDVNVSGLDVIDLHPGQTVVIQVAEKFNFPFDVGGVIFPPNSMSKSGVIMTNPGHIDPLFSGYISVYLVNMGKSPVKLRKGDKVATLLLFFIDGECDSDFKSISGAGVSKEQVLTLSKDFANLDIRMPDLLESVIRKKAFIWSGFFIALLSVVLSVVFTIIPIVSEQIFTNSMLDKFRLEYVSPLKISSDKYQVELSLLRSELKEKSAALESLNTSIKVKELEIKKLNSNVEKLYCHFGINKCEDFDLTSKEVMKNENKMR